MNRDKLIKKALYLAWFTIIYNIFETIYSILLGIYFNSIALAGFGGDSLIEIASSSFVLWRFKTEYIKNKAVNAKRERIATTGIGVSFIILSLIILISSLSHLINLEYPYSTAPGAIISLISIIIMSFVYKSKINIGEKIKSLTVIKDAQCSLACLNLSIILFLSSFLFLINPKLWYLDSIASILLAYFIFKEGFNTLRNKEKNISCLNKTRDTSNNCNI